MTPPTPAERSLLNQLLLHARGSDDAEAFALLTRVADAPDEFRALVASFKGVKEDRSAGKVKKTGTDKSGHKYTRWVNTDRTPPGGTDGDPAMPDHDPKLAAHAAEQMGEHLPDEVKKNPGLMARLGDALLTVAATVNLAALRNNHRIMQAVAIAENVFDVPQDMQKFGYAPTMSAQTASADAAAKADPLRTLTADATGVGVGTHLACTIASHVLGRLSVWAKNKVSGAKAESEQDADWAGLAEVVAGVFAAVNEALGMEGAPDAGTIEAKLREMFGGK